MSEYTKHDFGGPWTTEKLDILFNYINAYTTALKGLPFKKIYIDAFAGTGYRTPKSRVTPEADLFQDEPLDIDEKFLSGSARIALQATHPFDEYIFIEKNSRRCKGLTALREEFPHLADRISIRKADANTVIAEVCAELKSNSRALLFLDPYGMEVNWKTIEVIAGTRKIDVWYLFGLGGGLSRLLKNDGKISLDQKETINNVLGTTDWFDEFYRPKELGSLWEDEAFGSWGDDSSEYTKVANPEAIGEYLTKRLTSLFPGVAKNPRYLLNAKKSPLYLFCFAVSNPDPTAINLALKIAESILGKKRR